MTRIPSARTAFALIPLLAFLAGCGGDSRQEEGSARGAGSMAPGPPAGIAAPAPAPADPGAGLGYTLGSDDAPVTVVEFSDFGCTYCRRFAIETYPVLHDEFVSTGAVRWRYVPFVLGIFPHAELAARAAECAAEEDRFWEMHDLLYERQSEWRAAGPAAFAGYPETAGVERGRFLACLESGETDARTAAAGEAAERLGIRATPTFFVNGRRFEGALPLEQFRMLLHWSGAGAPAPS